MIDGDFPIDSLWIDSTFWDDARGPEGYLNFEGDREQFPDLSGFTETLEALNISFGIWSWGRLNETEAAWDEFEEKGFFEEYLPMEKSFHSNPETACADVDFKNQAASRRWNELLTPLVSEGIDFFKIDSFPTPEYVRTFFELVEGETPTGERGFIFAHTGGVDLEQITPYPTVWTGDSVIDWDAEDKDVPPYIPGGLRENVQIFADPTNEKSQIPFLSNDTGGFTDKFGSAEDREELYYRWTQFSSFTPIMEVFGHQKETGQNDPLAFSEGAQDNFRRYTHLRMRLFPYLYSYAYQTHLRNALIIRGSADHPEQYRFGEEFLVAPVVEPDKRERTVWLPPGERWRDYHTDEVYDGGQSVTIEAPLKRLPLFVRAGSIIPMREYDRSIVGGSNDPLLLDIYPGREATFDLYEDDGTSRAYESGDFGHTKLQYNPGADKTTVVHEAMDGTFEGAPEERTWQIRLHDAEEPAAVTYNDITLVETDSVSAGCWAYDGADNVLEVPVRASTAEEGTYTIQHR